MSFQEWVRNVSYGNRKFLEACEVGQNNCVNLIYNEKDEHIVQELFGQDVKRHAKEFFSEEAMEKIFSNVKPHIEESNVFEDEDVEYALFLKRKFESNPQDPGNETEHTFGQKTYAEASREPP